MNVFVLFKNFNSCLHNPRTLHLVLSVMLLNADTCVKILSTSSTVIWSHEILASFCNYVWSLLFHAHGLEFNTFGVLPFISNVWLKAEQKKQPPRKQTYIITVCCHVYNRCNCISTFTFCQTEDLLCNTDTGIMDFTSSTLFCCGAQIGNKLVHILWCTNLKIRVLLNHCRKFWSHYY